MDLTELWDFDRPEVSEARFRVALAGASGEEALVLRTQLARALGLQRRFDECTAELDAVQAQLGPEASATVRTYLALERGRGLRSASQPEAARPHFLAALDEARRAGLDHLAADAAHMLAIIGDPLEQLDWAQVALEIATSSSDPHARRWVGSVANNLGWTLHTLGRYEQAQERFEQALAARLEQGEPERVRVARWTVARGLRSLGRLDEALSIQQALHAEGPPDGYVSEELGELLHAMGRPDEARAHFQLAYDMLQADLAHTELDRLSRLRELGSESRGGEG